MLILNCCVVQQVWNCQICVSAIPAAYLLCSTAIRREIRAAWFFAIMNCPFVALSVFYSSVLMRSFTCLQLWTTLMQCRINNSSKCGNYYGPHSSWGPAVLCVTLLFFICKGGYYNLGARGKLSQRGPIYCRCYTESLFAESKFNFSFCWKFASAWKSISHGKSFEVIWFKIVLCLHIKFFEGPLLAHLHIIFALFFTNIWLASEFIKCGSRVLNKRFNKQSKN